MYLDASVKAAISKALNTMLQQSGLNDKEFMARHNITQLTYFNQVKKGTYSELYPKEDVWQKIADIVGFAEKRKYWQHFDMAHHAAIQKIAMRAQKSAESWIISADTGYGKSYSLIKLYQEAAPNQNIYYYRAYNEKVSPADFLRSILTIMGVKKIDTGRKVMGEDGKLKQEKKDIEKCGIAMLSNHIIELLCNRVSPLLIIDEAEFLSISCLKEIRKMVYETKGKAGIVICGADFEKRLNGLASRNKAQQQGWTQFHSRLQWNIATLMPIGYNKENKDQSFRWSEEINNICQKLGIKEAKVIKHISENSFNMRDLEHLISKLLEVSFKKGVPPTYNMLRLATENVQEYIKPKPQTT